MAVRRLCKEALISETIIFDYSDDPQYDAIHHSFAMNHIDIISLDGDGEPVVPTTGSYRIYVQTDSNGAFKNVTENWQLEASFTGGSAMDDGAGFGARFIGFPLTFKIVPSSDIDLAVSYRVNIKQSSAQLDNFKSPGDYLSEVIKGNLPGQKVIGVIARNPGVGNTFVDLWGPNETHIEPVQPGEEWELVFSSPNDTAEGTGAQEVEVVFLDNNYIAGIEYVASNGGTVQLAASNHLRPVTLRVTKTGSTTWNEGEITLQSVGTGNKQGLIPFADVGFCISQDGHYTIEAGKVGFGIQVIPFLPKNQDGTFRTVLQTEGGPRYIGAELPFYQSGTPIPIVAPFQLPGKTDLNFQAKTSNVDVQVIVSAALLIVDEEVQGWALKQLQPAIF